MLTLPRPYIPTLAERETDLDRVAVARYYVRFGRMPSQADLTDERTKMAWEARRGQKEGPDLNRAEMADWLKANGLSVPKAEPWPQPIKE